MFSVLLFLLLAGFIHAFKPAIMYAEDGAIRPFGVGYKHKTIVPIWFAFVILAIVCYMLANLAGYTE
jgi:hypothetical protein